MKDFLYIFVHMSESDRLRVYPVFTVLTFIPHLVWELLCILVLIPAIRLTGAKVKRPERPRSYEGLVGELDNR